MARIRTIKPVDLPKINDASPYQCTLYVVQEGDDCRLKIGVAQHPLRRLCTLQTGNWRTLHLRLLYEGSRAACLEVEARALKYFGCAAKTSWIYAELEDVEKFISAFVGEESA
jgi:hypothetical protein